MDTRKSVPHSISNGAIIGAISEAMTLIQVMPCTKIPHGSMTTLTNFTDPPPISFSSEIETLDIVSFRILQVFGEVEVFWN